MNTFRCFKSVFSFALFFNLCAFTVAQAVPMGGSIELIGSCDIGSGANTKTYAFSGIYPSKMAIAYTGQDGGRYKISIVNNGGTKFEPEYGSIAIGFARENAIVRNPPIACPSQPIERRKQCLEENERQNPPVKLLPTDRFEFIANNGIVDAEFSAKVPGLPPGQFGQLKFVVPRSQLIDGNSHEFVTMKADLGRIEAQCRFTAQKL